MLLLIPKYLRADILQLYRFCVKDKGNEDTTSAAGSISPLS